MAATFARDGITGGGEARAKIARSRCCAALFGAESLGGIERCGAAGGNGGGEDGYCDEEDEGSDCNADVCGRDAVEEAARRWGLALAARGAALGKKRAIIGVARKLAVVLHHLWITGEVYRPLHQAVLAAKPAA
jgi:hypothetical protein